MMKILDEDGLTGFWLQLKNKLYNTFARKTDKVDRLVYSGGTLSEMHTTENAQGNLVGTLSDVVTAAQIVTDGGGVKDISGKADKSATVSTVAYDTTNKKITKTINGTTSDVVTAAQIVTDGGGVKDISGKADKTDFGFADGTAHNTANDTTQGVSLKIYNPTTKKGETADVVQSSTISGSETIDTDSAKKHIPTWQGIMQWVKTTYKSTLDSIFLTDVSYAGGVLYADKNKTGTKVATAADIVNDGGAVRRSGDTMTGALTMNSGGVRIQMQTDESSSRSGMTWLDKAKSAAIAEIHFFNTAKRLILNAVGASQIFNDEKGKYSLVVGENRLTYDTELIYREGNLNLYNNETDNEGGNGAPQGVSLKRGTEYKNIAVREMPEMDRLNSYAPTWGSLYENVIAKQGTANGFCMLDANRKVPAANLPSYVDDVIEVYGRSGVTTLSNQAFSLTDGGSALIPESGKIYILMEDFKVGTGSSAVIYSANSQFRWPSNASSSTTYAQLYDGGVTRITDEEIAAILAL